MMTNEFLQLLAHTKDKILAFQVMDHQIPSNYHISEIKQTSIKSADCGHKEHQWKETSLHLFIPESDKINRPKMTSTKLLKIFNGLEYIDLDSKIKIEYANSPKSAISIYQIYQTSVNEKQILVELEAVQSECKPLNKAQISQAKSCCN